jgi:hypothetical protein
MDEIAFVVSQEPNGASPARVSILINGRNLAELARVVELPFAKAQSASSIAGAYDGLEASAVLPPSEHFLGRPSSRLYAYGERTQVLGCECGEPGCWPLVCRICVCPESVMWHDFRQPHRGANSRAGEWHYDGLGPFEFLRSPYEAALAHAAAQAAA